MGNQSSSLDKATMKKLSASTNFDGEELNTLYAAFKKMDTDKSGDLDFNEFSKLMKDHLKMDMSDETLKNLFKAFDSDDGNGKLSFKELATSLSLVGRGTAEQKLAYLFEVYDSDGSGTLSKDEIKAIIEQMRTVAKGLGRDMDKTESFIQAVMDKIDVDKDGNLTKEEWVQGGLKTPSLLTLIGGMSV